MSKQVGYKQDFSAVWKLQQKNEAKIPEYICTLPS